MNRTEIMQCLAENIEAAKVRCDHSRKDFMVATGLLNGRQLATAERIKEIGNEYKEAIQAAEEAYREQIDFIVDGIVPEWLRKRE